MRKLEMFLITLVVTGLVSGNQLEDTGRTGFGQTPPLGVAGLDDNSLFDNFFEKREHFKALVASPQKKTNDCLLITMNSICCNFVLELGSYAKKKEDKKTLGATGRRSEMTMQLHKSDIVIPHAMI